MSKRKPTSLTGAIPQTVMGMKRMSLPAMPAGKGIGKRSLAGSADFIRRIAISPVCSPPPGKWGRWQSMSKTSR